MPEDKTEEHNQELLKVPRITTKRYRGEGGIVPEFETAKKIEPEIGKSGEKTSEPFSPPSTTLYQRPTSSGKPSR